MSKEGKLPVTFMADTSLEGRIEAAADEQGKSKSALIREVMIDYLRHYELGKLSIDERYPSSDRHANEALNSCEISNIAAAAIAAYVKAQS